MRKRGKWKITQNIRHDGIRYAQGAEFPGELLEGAQHLVESGLIVFEERMHSDLALKRVMHKTQRLEAENKSLKARIAKPSGQIS